MEVSVKHNRLGARIRNFMVFQSPEGGRSTKWRVFLSPFLPLFLPVFPIGLVGDQWHSWTTLVSLEEPSLFVNTGFKCCCCTKRIAAVNWMNWIESIIKVIFLPRQSKMLKHVFFFWQNIFLLENSILMTLYICVQLCWFLLDFPEEKYGSVKIFHFDFIWTFWFWGFEATLHFANILYIINQEIIITLKIKIQVTVLFSLQ